MLLKPNKTVSSELFCMHSVVPEIFGASTTQSETTGPNLQAPLAYTKNQNNRYWLLPANRF